MAAWAGLGYYARARNLVAAAKVVVAEHNGAFPPDEASSDAAGPGRLYRGGGGGDRLRATRVVVDANVERVVARLFAIREALPGARVAIRAAADRVTPDARAGDFAQAMMDLGSGICTPKKPSCLLCPLQGECRAFREGDPERLPVKAAKKAKPQRHGTIFWLERDGAVWLVRRPGKGLLGGCARCRPAVGGCAAGPRRCAGRGGVGVAQRNCRARFYPFRSATGACRGGRRGPSPA